MIFYKIFLNISNFCDIFVMKKRKNKRNKKERKNEQYLRGWFFDNNRIG